MLGWVAGVAIVDDGDQREAGADGAAGRAGGEDGAGARERADAEAEVWRFAEGVEAHAEGDVAGAGRAGVSGAGALVGGGGEIGGGEDGGAALAVALAEGDSDGDDAAPGAVRVDGGGQAEAHRAGAAGPAEDQGRHDGNLRRDRNALSFLRRARRHLTTVTVGSDRHGCRGYPIGAKIGTGAGVGGFPMDDRPGQLSRYRLLEEVGQGGMAVVYRASTPR